MNSSESEWSYSDESIPQLGCLTKGPDRGPASRGSAAARGEPGRGIGKGPMESASLGCAEDKMDPGTWRVAAVLRPVGNLCGPQGQKKDLKDDTCLDDDSDETCPDGDSKYACSVRAGGYG